MSNLWTKVIGEKKEWRSMEARAHALPRDYRIVYGEIKQYMKKRGLPTIGVDIYTPDFLAIAQGFGWKAERARSVDQLRELLTTGAASDGPTLIEVLEHDEFLSPYA